MGKQIWADAAAIAARENKRLTLLLLLRYQLFFPPAQYVFRLRRRTLLARIPILGGVLVRWSWQRHCKAFAGDLSPGVQVGQGLHVPHPYGIIIGKGVRIGANVTIYQNVTIGVTADTPYPVIEDDVLIGAGAVILGAVTIGRGARIGANAVVLRDVPAGATAVGNPARIIAAQTTPLRP